MAGAVVAPDAEADAEPIQWFGRETRRQTEVDSRDQGPEPHLGSLLTITPLSWHCPLLPRWKRLTYRDLAPLPRANKWVPTSVWL